MKLRVLFFTLVGILLFACSTTDYFEPKSEYDITGYWINQQWNDTIYTYDKSTALMEDQYCFGFKENGEFIERKNSGSCATPPIAYADYEGIWELNDSIIEISVPFWGGMADYKWKVITLDNKKISFLILESNHEIEEWNIAFKNNNSKAK